MTSDEETPSADMDLYWSLCIFGPSYKIGVPGDSETGSFRNTLTDERFRNMFDYWHGLRQELGPFSHSDIHPRDIARLMQHYFLLEHDLRTNTITPRIAGTSFVELLGLEPTNYTFEDVAPPDYVDFWHRIVARVLDDQCPALLRWPLDFVGKDYRDVVCLTLPLKKKDGSEYVNGIALPARSARLDDEALETA